VRYAQRGWYTPAEQQRRERLWTEAAGRFACGDEISDIPWREQFDELMGRIVGRFARAAT
jgi:hypothetical protein